MSKTPWAKHHPPPASSFPSDRLKPSNQNSKPKSAKAKPPTPEPPKSRRVRVLENLIADLQQGKLDEDPKGGCFCQGRHHPISAYIPLCPTCSLIRCSLNLPTHLCSSCSSSPFEQASQSSSPSRDTLVKQLMGELALVLEGEERRREEKVEERRRLMGTFPTLSSTSSSSNNIMDSSLYPQQQQQQQQQQQTPHKVLSLNSKTRKATVTSYTPALPSTTNNNINFKQIGGSGSRPPSPDTLKEIQDESKRVGKPVGMGCVYHAAASQANVLKWTNLLLDMEGGGGEKLVYVEGPNGNGKGKEGRNKGKGKGKGGGGGGSKDV